MKLLRRCLATRFLLHSGATPKASDEAGQSSVHQFSLKLRLQDDRKSKREQRLW